MPSVFFKPHSADYTISVETIDNKLTKFGVKIPKPYFTTFDQFDGKFSKGDVDGVNAQVLDLGNDAYCLEVSLDLTKKFSSGDKLFRQTIFSLVGFTLKEKDEVINNYNRHLLQFGLRSDFMSSISKKESSDKPGPNIAF